MNEELISHKTAKLAKEKGFDIIPRFGNDSSLYSKRGKHVWYTNYGFMASGLSDGYISAPTQSLLQRWLREVHHEYIGAVPAYGGWTYWRDGHYKVSWTRYNSYEEALEQALILALNQIK